MEFLNYEFDGDITSSLESILHSQVALIAEFYSF